MTVFFIPPVAPSPGTTFTPQIKVLEAEFGDGYSQPTPNGINNIRETVELKWDGLTECEMHAIYDFFIECKGTKPFLYKPAGYRKPVAWTCKEWTRNLSEGIWKITANLTQSFASI